jgi:hypothetical protein
MRNEREPSLDRNELTSVIERTFSQRSTVRGTDTYRPSMRRQF